ncbi:MAG TPA: hypothetical protein VEY70_02650 [Metabacillus sp.]|nr:hypothetical protein [Metabacillus sp.]
MKEHVDEINRVIKVLKGENYKKISLVLNLDKCARLVEKLDSLATTCKECEQFLLEFKEHFIHLNANKDKIDKIMVKKHKQLLYQTELHLKKKHKSVPEGYYFGTYMSLGMSLGIIFGLTLFDNIALGLPIGLSIGIAIGDWIGLRC